MKQNNFISAVRTCKTRKLCYRKDDRAMHMGALKILGTPDYAHGYYSQHFSCAYVRIAL